MTVLLAACCKDSFDYGVFTGDDINQQKKYECYDSIVVDYRYHTPEVYQSLKSMLASLKRQGFKLIVNGGDVFVSETLKDGSAKKLYDGVNQEDVFTTYDFNKKKYGRQTKKIRIITKDTLSRPRKQDLTSTSSNIEPARNFQKKSLHIASDTGINGTMPTELI